MSVYKCSCRIYIIFYHMRPFNKTTATLVRPHPFSTLCTTPLGKMWVCKCESSSSRFQPGEGPSLVGAFSVIVKLGVIFAKVRLKLYSGFRVNPDSSSAICHQSRVSQSWCHSFSQTNSRGGTLKIKYKWHHSLAACNSSSMKWRFRSQPSLKLFSVSNEVN